MCEIDKYNRKYRGENVRVQDHSGIKRDTDAVYGLNAEEYVETERHDLGEHVRSNSRIMVVDPIEKQWRLEKLKEEEIDEVLDKVISRGEDYSKQVSLRTSQRNPLNFDCSTKDIVDDLF